MILDRISSGLSGPPLLSGFVLALVNMVPVIGVMMWDWSVFDIVSLYWAEILIIGAFNIPRMLMAKGGSSPGNTSFNRVQSGTRHRSAEVLAKEEGTIGTKKAFVIPFFLVHFGLFCTVQAFFVFFLLENAGLHNPFRAAPDLLGKVFEHTGLAFSLFILGHLFSFFWNFIGQREYRETFLPAQMWKPYSRIVILQIAVLFGAFAVAMSGAPLVLLLSLIAGKTALDLGFHFYSHGGKQGQPGYGKAATA